MVIITNWPPIAEGLTRRIKTTGRARIKLPTKHKIECQFEEQREIQFRNYQKNRSNWLVSKKRNNLLTFDDAALGAPSTNLWCLLSNLKCTQCLTEAAA